MSAIRTRLKWRVCHSFITVVIIPKPTSIPSKLGHNLRNYGGHLAQTILVVQHEDQAQDEDAQHVQGERDEEEEEEPIVPAADAIVHPRAVMVERLHAFKGRRRGKGEKVSRLLISVSSRNSNLQRVDDKSEKNVQSQPHSPLHVWQQTSHPCTLASMQ